MNATVEELRYPIGKLQMGDGPATAEERRKMVETIAELPEQLKQAIAGLNGKQLDTA